MIRHSIFYFLILMLSFSLASCQKSQSQSPSTWPPQLGKEFPNLILYDHQGQLVDLKKKFKGKVIIVEPIGMTCPACNAFAGAGKGGGKSKFKNVNPQANMATFPHYLKQYGGVSINNPDIVWVHLLLYNMKMKGATQEDAKAWGAHFGANSTNHIVLAGGPSMVNSASYAMIPGFFLIDRKFVLQSDSTGHHPKQNLYTYLLPKVKKLLAEPKP